MRSDGLNWFNNLPKWDGGNFSPFEVPKVILSGLGNPQDSFQAIHIAGTNGKGSVAAYLDSILCNCGKYHSIGKFTSPYLISLTESATVNGSECSSAEFSDVFLEVKVVSENLNLIPTQFVALVCAVFYLFKQMGVQLAIVEAGLGGRYDATNVLTNKCLNIITSIGFEHEDQLGDSLESIAVHKAGVINSKAPTILGRVNRSLLGIFKDEATRYGSELLVCDDFRDLCDLQFNKNEPQYKINNRCLAFMGAELLGIDRLNIIAGLKSAKWPGRFEIYQNESKDRLAIIDVAHNIDGIRELFSENVVSYLKSQGRICLVVTFLRRKNWKAMLEFMANVVKKNELPSELIVFSPNVECVDVEMISLAFPELRFKSLSSLDDFEGGGLTLFFGSTIIYKHFTLWAQAQKLLPESER